ncbi:4a-hydroxytetrahydrobiopterin dehydratase [Thiocystis violacea]|uniref:4a-hydroxytetrahydrobiopterin dehydratase n=1 Tax=Thiocystis violacea TaxID=13725 RepID=UPI001903F61B|nr:4a-hydroxytetrahydrobiopterin dehydratase [Thiocystis violacea]MBK1719048.1 4a-hydroxytetrahydrobiopterin dehydratase [Thiocystis violacea]
MSTDKIHTEAEIRQRLQAELPHWYYADGAIHREYRTSGWKGTLMVINTVGHLAEAAWHHPDLHASYARIIVTLLTHSANGVTDKDFELARKIEDTVTWRPAADSALEGTPDDARYEYIKYD